MQALPDCSIAEEAQDEDEEAGGQEEEQGLPLPAKGLFGRTQALKAQPQQPEVMPFPSLMLSCSANRQPIACGFDGAIRDGHVHQKHHQCHTMHYFLNNCKQQ